MRRSMISRNFYFKDIPVHVKTYYLVKKRKDKDRLKGICLSWDSFILRLLRSEDVVDEKEKNIKELTKKKDEQKIQLVLKDKSLCKLKEKVELYKKKYGKIDVEDG